MEHRCECSACNALTGARPPNKAFWGLIVAFWGASLVLGFGASRAGWPRHHAPITGHEAGMQHRHA